MKTKRLLGAMLSAAVLGAIVPVQLARAHVTVRPADVKAASYTTFTVSVPNERDVATVGVELRIPEVLSSVMPTVKPGWTISTETANTSEGTTGHGDGTKVVSINWTDGEVPVGQRDEFTFSARTPDTAGELQWKAYQTYADGTVVAWDRSDDDQPKNADGSPDFSTAGPFSVTTVQEDAQAAAAPEPDTKTAQRAFYIAIAAVVVSFISLVISTKPQKRK